MFVMLSRARALRFTQNDNGWTKRENDKGKTKRENYGVFSKTNNLSRMKT